MIIKRLNNHFWISLTILKLDQQNTVISMDEAIANLRPTFVATGFYFKGALDKYNIYLFIFKVAWSAMVTCSDLLENDIKCVY